MVFLRSILEGTARSTGEEFFQSLVRRLAEAIDVHYAFVTEFTDTNTRVRTLAFWARDRIEDNIEYDLAGTPCEDVLAGSFCHYPTGIPEKFPEDKGMIDMGIQSFLGVPLLDVQGTVLGHLAVFDDRPMPAEPRRLYTFRIFAARAAAELERLRIEKRLRDSEERYRDLYEEAPNAYVSLGIDGKLSSANRRAAQLLGWPKEELVGSVFIDHFGSGTGGRQSAAEALRRCLLGEEVSGWELEMRRRDGDSVWISLWMKPLRGRNDLVQSCRSIWVDITARVRAEAERARLHQQNLYLQDEIKSVHNFEEIVGRSPAIEAVLENVRRVAPTDACVLITGETGTGKELIARALHSLSKRRDRPLIKINCAALPTGLVESELFGHEKGAFSGAIARRIGRFELAHGGTFFLDEIGEVPLDVQVKLLRVLQEREFDRVGGSQPVKVDVRIIAATNRDLQKAAREGKFREDLYYRLNVFPVHVPPLRERAGDIPLLAQHLVSKFSARLGKPIAGIGGETMERLQEYSWPGNVRELENILERAVIISSGELLEIDSTLLTASREPASSDGEMAPPDSEAGGKESTMLEAVERDHIIQMLKQANWIIDGPRGAARTLGLHPNTLRSRMKKLGIRRA